MIVIFRGGNTPSSVSLYPPIFPEGQAVLDYVVEGKFVLCWMRTVYVVGNGRDQQLAVHNQRLLQPAARE